MPRRCRAPLPTRLKRSNKSCSQIVLTAIPQSSPRHFACVASCKRSKGGAKQPRQTSAQHSCWRAVWARYRWSCVRLQASRGCCAILAAATKRARCWPKSTTGSSKASTPPTSRRQGAAGRTGHLNQGGGVCVVQNAAQSKELSHFWPATTKLLARHIVCDKLPSQSLRRGTSPSLLGRHCSLILEVHWHPLMSLYLPGL